MKKRYEISLNGEWELYYSPEKNGKPQKLDEIDITKFAKIKAMVPGNIELDLMNAGIEQDPFYSDNIYKYSEYEYYQWVFIKNLFIPTDFTGDRIILQFNGIDTIADIYMNGNLVGHSENMLIAHSFDVTDHIKAGEENKIVVHISSIMNFARNKEYTMAMRGTVHRNEICWLRKAPHSFGWDIAPRLLSAGLWRAVALASQPNTRILETYYATPEITPEGIYLEYGYRFTTDADTLDNFRIRISGSCGDSHFEDDRVAHFVSANHSMLIENPKLWWPKGYGEQPLYAIKMELIYNGDVVDSKEERIGLRSVRLERSFTRGNQEFKFFINNVPIMIKGTNWVPLDALHSRDEERLDRVHDLIDDSGCNTIRCWGGNVYEDTRFFDKCDERGLLVWQDFAMGNTNYPQTQDFAKVIEEEIGFQIRKTRNHPCLLIWSSDNEIDFKNTGFHLPHYDSRYNRVSHETLVRVVQAHDQYRYYLKSSPEIPEGFGTDDVPEQHMWGQRAYFKDDFYKHCTAHFIGEAGYHGCPAVSSLKKFIPADKLWPYENKIWAIHSTEDIRITPEINERNHLMANQVKLMFGEIPEDIEKFSLLSQISQAEAMKFFIERTKAMKWRRTGIIWWNMIDCWPQISDSVVDYYFEKKLAYHYIKRVQQPICLLMTEQSGWEQTIMICNDSNRTCSVQWCVTDGESGDIILQGEDISPANENITVGKINPVISEKKLYILTWADDGIECGNHYISGFPPYDSDKMIKWAEEINNHINGLEKLHK